MATITPANIPTIRNRYPELFAPRPPRIHYTGQDQLIHLLPAHPFCADSKCPCHRDAELVGEYIATPHAEGILTSDEGLRILLDQQV